MSEKYWDFINMAAILTACRLENYLNNIKSERFHGKLTRFVEPYKNLSIEYFADYPELNMKNASVSKIRYYYLLEKIPEKHRNTAETLLGLSILYALYPEVRDSFKEVGITVSINTAYRLENNENCPASAASELFESLNMFFLIEKKENEWYAEMRFHADHRLLDYLMGKNEFPNKIKNHCMLFSKDLDLPPLFLYQDECCKLAFVFSDKNNILHIRGGEKCGKKFLVKHIAKKCGTSVLFVDFKIMLEKNLSDIEAYILLILREVVFYNAAVCWYNVKKEWLEKWDLKIFSEYCIEYFLKQNIQVCCCTEKAIKFMPNLPLGICVYDIPQLTQQNRISLWNSFCIEEQNEKIDSAQFAIRYKFSCGQIAEVFQRRNSYISIKDENEKQIFESICSDIANPSEKLFNILHSNYLLSDLMIPNQEKDKIMEICANFQYYNKVYNEWDMQSKMPYGRAVSVLLCGPPGTGKTMTAHVIANQLELPLFHVDLSQISDKYIGETEKHLEEIFSEAEKSNCILLLDEADAICGKRSEVTDSRDRYANNDTAFLLQRLEQYDGIVIMATNFVNNIDNAFMRRIKYIIQFSIPDACIRKKIWLNCFPEKLPVSSDLDIDYLAEQFELSGANIKNIVLESSFLAASENQPIQMQYILQSIGNEYLKFQKNILPGEFGQYSDMYLKISEKNTMQN